MMRRAEAVWLLQEEVCKTSRRKETKMVGKEMRTDELFDQEQKDTRKL
jgi:hypothetical protein